MVDSVNVGAIAVGLRRARLRRAAESRTKRLLDLSVAVTALLLLTPVFLLIAMAIYFESGGPVLFRQKRTGLRGHEFTVLKFRTMQVMEDGFDLRQATRNDPRVTRVGLLLRRTSLDELPQLI